MRATVTPDSTALRSAGPDTLALIGRGLAVRGGALFVIRMADDDAVRLIPASAWGVQHGTADPATWRYRVDMIGPSGSTIETLPAAGVVHVRIGADPKAAWHGREPLQRAAKTGELGARIEGALITETKLPIGRIAPYFGNIQAAQFAAGRQAGFEAAVTTICEASGVPREQIEQALQDAAKGATDEVHGGGGAPRLPVFSSFPSFARFATAAGGSENSPRFAETAKKTLYLPILRRRLRGAHGHSQFGDN